MKVNRFHIWLVKKHLDGKVKKVAKQLKKENIDGQMDIPYRDGAGFYEHFDVLKAEGKKNGICIINIHGGAYVLSSRKGNIRFGQFFTKKGYDFVAIDYRPNKGKRDVKDMFDDCMAGISNLFAHLKELGLEGDRFVLSGDSAGGHLALLVAEAFCDKEYAKLFGYEFAKPIEAIAAFSPAYDYETLGDNEMTRSGRRRMFGPRFEDKVWRRLLSPRERIEKMTLPLFHSTCKNDFIRGESDKLYADCKNRGDMYTFIDIQSDNPKVEHVHNVIYVDEPESIEVNEAVDAFFKKHLGK